MDLTPKLPPGRANRKALAFAAEIHKLRAAGYSFEAIRLALHEAGVQVSRTTVKREAAKRLVITCAVLARPAPQRSAQQPASITGASSSLQEQTQIAPMPGSFVNDSRSGKEIVEAFMQGRITNPLMQARMKHEGRSN